MDLYPDNVNSVKLPELSENGLYSLILLAFIILIDGASASLRLAEDVIHTLIKANYCTVSLST